MVIVYDVNVKRVSKVCNFLRMYLNWVQNSVFEGELTYAELEKVKLGLKKIIDENEDSLLIYIVRDGRLLKREHIGVKKADFSLIV